MQPNYSTDPARDQLRRAVLVELARFLGLRVRSAGFGGEFALDGGDARLIATMARHIRVRDSTALFLALAAAQVSDWSDVERLRRLARAQALPADPSERPRTRGRRSLDALEVVEVADPLAALVALDEHREHLARLAAVLDRCSPRQREFVRLLAELVLRDGLDPRQARREAARRAGLSLGAARVLLHRLRAA